MEAAAKNQQETMANNIYANKAYEYSRLVSDASFPPRFGYLRKYKLLSRSTPFTVSPQTSSLAETGAKKNPHSGRIAWLRIAQGIGNSPA